MAAGAQTSPPAPPPPPNPTPPTAPRMSHATPAVTPPTLAVTPASTDMLAQLQQLDSEAMRQLLVRLGEQIRSSVSPSVSSAPSASTAKSVSTPGSAAPTRAKGTSRVIAPFPLRSEQAQQQARRIEIVVLFLVCGITMFWRPLTDCIVG